MFIITSHILVMSYIRIIEKGNLNENQDIDIDSIGMFRTDFRFSHRREPF
jgi:hypothetical protein